MDLLFTIFTFLTVGFICYLGGYTYGKNRTIKRRGPYCRQCGTVITGCCGHLACGDALERGFCSEMCEEAYDRLKELDMIDAGKGSTGA